MTRPFSVIDIKPHGHAGGAVRRPGRQHARHDLCRRRDLLDALHAAGEAGQVRIARDQIGQQLAQLGALARRRAAPRRRSGRPCCSIASRGDSRPAAISFASASSSTADRRRRSSTRPTSMRLVDVADVGADIIRPIEAPRWAAWALSTPPGFRQVRRSSSWGPHKTIQVGRAAVCRAIGRHPPRLRASIRGHRHLFALRGAHNAWLPRRVRRAMRHLRSRPPVATAPLRRQFRSYAACRRDALDPERSRRTRSRRTASTARSGRRAAWSALSACRSTWTSWRCRADVQVRCSAFDLPIAEAPAASASIWHGSWRRDVLRGPRRSTLVVHLAGAGADDARSSITSASKRPGDPGLIVDDKLPPTRAAAGAGRGKTASR